MCRGFYERGNRKDPENQDRDVAQKEQIQLGAEELLAKMFEEALLFGMTPKQFWYDDPNYFWVYGRMYQKKQMLETQDKLNFAWQNGMYNMIGFSQAIANAMSKKKVNIYPKKPVNILEVKPKIKEDVHSKRNYFIELTKAFNRKKEII